MDIILLLNIYACKDVQYEESHIEHINYLTSYNLSSI